MQASTAFWHLLDFFGPAAGLGLVAPLLAKALWRHAFQGTSWFRLVAATGGVSALVLVAGLLAFGRDGMTATYGAMVMATALMLWWCGFGRPRR